MGRCALAGPSADLPPVATIEAGWPPAYAREAGTDGPSTVLTFWSGGPELEVLRRTGHPFFGPPWGPDVVGMVLDASPDWVEIAELLTELLHARPRDTGPNRDAPRTLSSDTEREYGGVVSTKDAEVGPDGYVRHRALVVL